MVFGASFNFVFTRIINHCVTVLDDWERLAAP